MQKRKNPFARQLSRPLYKLRIVPSKKGKGSYKRKDRNKRSFLLGARKVLTIAVPKTSSLLIIYPMHFCSVPRSVVLICTLPHKPRKRHFATTIPRLVVIAPYHR